MDGRTEMTGKRAENLLLLEFSLQPSEAGGIKVKMLEREEGENENAGQTKRESCISSMGWSVNIACCSANIDILSHINTAYTSPCYSEP